MIYIGVVDFYNPKKRKLKKLEIILVEMKIKKREQNLFISVSL